MKASLLALAITFGLFQVLPPPPSPPPPPPPQIGQRGQTATPAAPQPAPLDAAQCKCSIEVTVKRSTGEPIGDVAVSLNQSNNAAITTEALATLGGLNINGTLADSLIASATRTNSPSSPPPTATTDGSGRAVFHDLAEGSYLVQAKRDGYFGISNDTYSTQAIASAAVGPETPTGARGAARQRVQQIMLNMVQGVTLSGSIFDANRRPASAVQVGAYRVTYQDGHRVLTLTGTAVQTDDRGDYRLFWFPPGEYYVRTGGGSGTAALLRAALGNGGNAQVATYYPGTTDPQSAIPVVIREGSDMTGINIALQASSGVTVSGTIVNTAPGGRVGPQGQVNRTVASVYLVPRNPYFWETPALISNAGAASRAARGGSPPNDSETPFEIRGLAPGTYDFYPVFSSGATPSATSGLPLYYSARTKIEVGTQDIAGIQSVIGPGTDLKGHVTISGNPPAAAPNRAGQTLTLANIRVRVQPKDNIPSLVRTGLTTTPALDADGGFNLLNLVEGQYFVSGVSPLPTDAYVSEIRQDSRSIFDENTITIGKDAQSTLEVTVSRGGGTIQGTVQDGKHNPIASAWIRLIPDMPRRQNSLLYKSATSNAMGNFNLSGVAPGNYKLFAWEHNPAGAEQNAEYMRDYDALGVSVNVSQGLPLANIQVPIIPTKY